jgi:hypothetical protein
MGNQQLTLASRELDQVVQHTIPRDIGNLVGQYAAEYQNAHCMDTVRRTTDPKCRDTCVQWLYEYIFADRARYAVFVIKTKSRRSEKDTKDTKSKSFLVFVPIHSQTWIFGNQDKAFVVGHEMDYQDMYVTWLEDLNQAEAQDGQIEAQDSPRKRLVDVERSGYNGILTMACEFATAQESKIFKRVQLYMNSGSIRRLFIGFADENKLPISNAENPYVSALGFGSNIRLSYHDDSNREIWEHHTYDDQFENLVNAIPEIEYVVERDNNNGYRVDFPWSRFKKLDDADRQRIFDEF